MNKTGDKIEFIKKNNKVYFYLIIDKIENNFINVSVYEVTQWSADGLNTYEECEASLYLNAYIKWDGCSHVTFCEEGMHLCGKRYWKHHSDMMTKLYETCTELLPGYSKEFDE